MFLVNWVFRPVESISQVFCDFNFENLNREKFYESFHVNFPIIYLQKSFLYEHMKLKLHNWGDTNPVVRLGASQSLHRGFVLRKKFSCLVQKQACQKAH